MTFSISFDNTQRKSRSRFLLIKLLYFKQTVRSGEVLLSAERWDRYVLGWPLEKCNV